MKQRIFNYIISLCNFIGIIGLIIITQTVYNELGDIAIHTYDIKNVIGNLINTCFYSILIIFIIFIVVLSCYI